MTQNASPKNVKAQPSRIKRIWHWFKSRSWKIKAVMGIVLAAVVAGAVALGIYFNQPENVVSGVVQNPGVSSVSDNKVYPSPVMIAFAAPVAKMEMVDKAIDSIRIFPNIGGRWAWVDQAHLVFMPEYDWAPKTTYTVTLPKDIFDMATYTVKPLEYQVQTPAFEARMSDVAFYEDPVNVKIKRVTATLDFTHPVDMDDLKKMLKIGTISGDTYGFTVTGERMNRRVYVVTDPVKIKAEEDFLTIAVQNVKNIYNGETLENPVREKITIPSSSTFFKVNSATSDIILNQEKENDAEQILFLNFSSAVRSNDLTEYIDLYQYGGYCGDFNSAYRKLADKDADVSRVTKVSKLDYVALPLEKEADKTHTFKYFIKEPKNVCVVAQVKRGLQSVDGFTLADRQVRVVEAARFPSDVKIAFDGALLSFTGDKRLSLVTRGLNKVEVNVARIPAGNINHLVSQTYGDFKNPSFRGYFDADNIAENFKETLKLNTASPEKQNYASVDLNKYFETKKGIFIASVNGYRAGDTYASTQDERLVLVTNIGIIAKNNKDKSHTVFVSNFATGKPIPEARVEVLGKNGIPVLTQTTNEDGVVDFPNFSDFKREKQPVAYVVTKGGDVSYMPVDKYDRQLDYSRFDVEGVYGSDDEKRLRAYAFSDRGIYRPGEEAHFGVIVRDEQLNTPKKNEMKVEIFDSYGDSVLERKLTVPESGLFDINYTVNPLARTGEYDMRVSVLKENRYYSSIGSASFRVEEFVPETMRIKAKIGAGSSAGWLYPEGLKAVVTLENLYGNPAAEHTVAGDMTLTPTGFHFAKYEDYVFTDPLYDENKRPVSVEDKLADQKTDVGGVAHFDIDLSQYIKGTYRLTFRAEGLEAAGGRSVSAGTSVLVSPLKTLVGYKKDGDYEYVQKASNRSVHFIAIDSELNMVDVSGLTREVWERKYVSTLVKQSNGMFKYQSVEKLEKTSADMVTLSRDGMTYSLDTSRAGSFYVQLTDGEGQVLARVNYTVAGAHNLTYSLEKNAELSLKLNKGEYIPGETIEMHVKAPYAGYGLITIERDNVYAYKWFKAETTASVQHIQLPDNVEGNAYVNVAFIRDLESKEIFMSPLSYAVAPFKINKAKRMIRIDLDAPKLVKSGEDMVIDYKASDKGKIIIYGVNEGILSYAKYQTPNPLATFMPKQALRVATYQILDLILPDASLIKNRASTGGDEMETDEVIARNLNPFARKVDKPVAFWSGIIDVDKESKKYVYTVPDNFNGQIRVMAVAVNDVGFGVTQKTALVRGDFAMTPSAPFNVIPGDVFEVGTSVANMVEGSKKLNTTISVSSSTNLEIVGDKTVTDVLDERGEKSYKFSVKALDGLGDGTVTFTAESGVYRSKMTIHVGVRPGMPYTTALVSGYAKKSVELKNFKLNMFEQYRTQQVVASTSPLVLARGLVKYLDKYPYGCTEQTVSRAFPMMAMLFDHPTLVADVKVYDLFDAALAVLKVRQTNRGGFSAWAEHGTADDFASVYAYHFLTYARGRGFDVPDMMMSRAAAYMKEIAKQTPEDKRQADVVAYAIYALTLNGEITTNYLINLEQYLSESDKKWRETLAASYVASSYKLLKNDIKANDIIGRYTMGKDDAKDAQYLYLMANHFEKEFQRVKEEGVQVLLKPLQKGRFNSISSAYAILALGAYPSSKDADAHIQFSAGTATYPDFAQVDFSGLKNEEVLKATSDASFFYTVTQQGFNKEMPKKVAAEGIEVIKEIRNAKGEAITSAKLGDEVTVSIRIKSNQKEEVNDVALVDLIPGCFEIVPNSVTRDNIDSFEVREDRVVFYVPVSRTMSELAYRAKVIAKGEFVVPPSVASALYDADVKANTLAGKITVGE